jgi:hypothetical protein
MRNSEQGPVQSRRRKRSECGGVPAIEQPANVVDFAAALAAKRDARAKVEAEDKRFRDLNAIEFCMKHAGATAIEREYLSELFTKLLRNPARVMSEHDERQVVPICKRLRLRDEAMAALEDARERFEVARAARARAEEPGRAG